VYLTVEKVFLIFGKKMYNHIKKIFNGKVFVISLLLLAFAAVEANACDMKFEILKGKKAAYQKGDIVIVKLIVVLTHRNCPVALKETKFDMKGVKVVGATKWKMKDANTWTRKLKIKITGSSKDEAFISGTRTCDKEGGYSIIKFKVQ